MRLQEIFNRVSRHLLRQNAKSLGPVSGGCAYRGDAGRKCAIGCLITNAYYDHSLEAKSVQAANVRSALARSIGQKSLSQNQQGLCQQLQAIHDNYEPPSWAARLVALASDYGLKASF